MHTNRPTEVNNPAEGPATGLEGAFALPAGALRALAHRAVDDWCDQLETLADEPAWRSAPADVRARLAAPLARDGEGLEAAYAAFLRDVRPYRYGNVHPRFWGWVNGSGLPSAVLADFLTATMNSNAHAFDQAAIHVEEQVLSWLRAMLPFDGADGVLTSGGSVANLLALAAARHAHAPGVREHGLAEGGRGLVLYGSSETHSSVHKAVELLGLGLASFRRLPVDDAYRLRVDALEAALAEDRARGLVPFALVANAGTVNTGAIDPLDALADVAAREGLWLHVDGAFGGLAWLVAERRAELAGLERADSLAFDLHKWLYLPIDVGCVLVRRPNGLSAAFGMEAAYLARLEGGLGGHPDGAFKDRGIELTRRFRALKAWFALKTHGLAAFEAAIRANLEQARGLAAAIEAEPRLELLAPAPLNVVCFRYRGSGRDDAQLDALNRRLLVRLQESGVAVPSQTVLGGRFALRCAFTNHRTRSSDLDLLLREVLRLGAELEPEPRAPRPSPTPTTP